MQLRLLSFNLLISNTFFIWGINQVFNKAKVSLDLKDIHGQTAAWIAASKGYTDVLKAIVECKTETGKTFEYLKDLDENNHSPAWAAMQGGHLDVLKVRSLLAEHF